MGEIHQLLLQQGLEGARRATSLDKARRLCVEAAHAVLGDEEQCRSFIHAGFAMTALPHKRVAEPIWERKGGKDAEVTLLVESGLDINKQPIGVPYGSIARMILLYLQTQAVRTGSREVELGASMNAWLTAMDIPVGGKTYQIVREQARRISRCRLTFLRRTRGAEFVTNGAFVRDSILPVDPQHNSQLPLWQERVRLDEGFYESLVDHPLPIREEAIRQISKRSMAIDLYIWLSYRLHVLREPLALSWRALKEQFGEGYSELRFFRRDVRPSLELALAVYPEARVEMDEDGVMLYPSPPPVQGRKQLTA